MAESFTPDFSTGFEGRVHQGQKYRARYVEVEVIGWIGDSLLICKLPSGEEVHLPPSLVDGYYVPVHSTTAMIEEEL